MKTNYTIKNFRVFDNNGVTVEMSPLTFLVGCNSSGKSSIVKSLFLLKAFSGMEFDDSHPIVGSTIDFSSSPLNTLGSFDNVIRSSSRKKEMTLSYDVHSCYLNEDVHVTLTLGPADLGNAVVTGITIAMMDGTVIAGDGKQNLYRIKKNYRDYMVAVGLRKRIEEIRSLPEYDDPEIRKELNSKIESHIAYALRFCDEEYLNLIYDKASIKSTDLDYNWTVNKFIQTGITTYFSVFEPLRGVKDVERIRTILVSMVKEGDLKDAMVKAIEAICEDYEASGSEGFLSYYLAMEDSFLYKNGGRFLPFVRPRRSVLEVMPIYRPDEIKALKRQMEKGNETTIMPNYHLLYDLMAHLEGKKHYLKSEREDPEEYPFAPFPLAGDVFIDYLEKVVKEIVSSDVTGHVEYISSSRIQVRRMYPMEDKTEFTDAVKRYYDARNKFMALNPPIRLKFYKEGEKKVSDFMPGSFMNKWLYAFKVGHHISLEMDKNGLGLLLKVYKSETDRKGVLLADMGYGITQLFSILLQIEEMIMTGLTKLYENDVTSVEDIRRGVTCYANKYKEFVFEPCTIAIEEPEIHLHPKFQSLLAEMFKEAYKEYGIQFVVETHSEYLLRKIQTMIGLKVLDPEEVSMIYVEDDEEVKKGARKIRRIPIKEDGRLAEQFGPGFYDEVGMLSRELLKIWINQQVEE